MSNSENIKKLEQTPPLDADKRVSGANQRKITTRSSGLRHGPITRLMSPGDLG